MRQMSSVRPTRGKADNPAGSEKPLFNDWLPVCGFHPGPEPTLAPTQEAVDTCAVATLRSSPSSPFKRGKHPDDREFVFS
jgi:hypothetical protein